MCNNELCTRENVFEVEGDDDGAIASPDLIAFTIIIVIFLNFFFETLFH